MQVLFTRITHLTFIFILVFLIYKRAPDFINHFKAEGAYAPHFKVEKISGEMIDSDNLRKPLILIFWATWCGPCQLELSRINQMILTKKIPQDGVLAISIQEDNSIVERIRTERNYKFNIALDRDGSIAKLFKINSTPSIIFIEKNTKIKWMSAGLSPLLEIRISNFLQSH